MGKRGTELMIEHGVGVRSSRVLEFKHIDENFLQMCEAQGRPRSGL
jgi:restriction endonuclease Mrr